MQLCLFFAGRNTLLMKKLFSTNYSDNAFNIGIFVMRVVAGLSMAVSHGYGKLTDFSTTAVQQASNPYHLPGNVAAGMLVFAEFFCAILIVLGLLTRFAAFALIIAMGTAFFVAHKGQLFAKGSEASAMFLVIFFALLLVGPGKFSADKLIGK
ncbi:MAG: DoxX family protein [Chitinophagaceae bacterium]|nr:MAG: DoxX family protein [Chitinophagaceae bacterium]